MTCKWPITSISKRRTQQGGLSTWVPLVGMPRHWRQLVGGYFLPLCHNSVSCHPDSHLILYLCLCHGVYHSKVLAHLGNRHRDWLQGIHVHRIHGKLVQRDCIWSRGSWQGRRLDNRGQGWRCRRLIGRGSRVKGQILMQFHAVEKKENGRDLY